VVSYTAIDDCTRVRVLRLYRRQNHRSSLAFLRELTAAFPFQIRKIQVDNGTGVPLVFALSCQELGVRVRYIRRDAPNRAAKSNGAIAFRVATPGDRIVVALTTVPSRVAAAT